MKILVTGGAGYLGSVLVNKLLEKSYQVAVFDILMFGGESLINHISDSHFSLIRGDIRNKNLLQEILFNGNFDAVIHLAALVGEPACKINPLLTKQINYKASCMLAKLAKKSKVKRFIFTSSCSNYGVADPNDFANEDSPLTPLSLYAQTKIAAEKNLLLLGDNTFTISIIRLATIFGLSPKMRFNLLINEMVRDAFFGKIISLYKENAWRPYTHIQDAADALILLLEAEKEKISQQIFNVGTENYRKKDLVRILGKFFQQIEIKKEGGSPDNRDYRVSFEKIKRELKLMPQKTVSQGIEEMASAIKNNLFFDPYDKKYTLWLNEELFSKNI